MRLKHRPWGDEFVKTHPELIKNRYTLEDNDFLDFLKRDNLELEIGVGRGDFIINKAKKHPEVNFLGIEKSMMALAITGKKIGEEHLENLLLVNIDVSYLFERLPDAIFNCIYLNFSDPWPKKRQHKRRLTYPSYLDAYYRLLKNGGEVIFKTDNDVLFADSKEYFASSKFSVISIDEDYQLVANDEETEYEHKFRALGVKIKRLVARKD